MTRGHASRSGIPDGAAPTARAGATNLPPVIRPPSDEDTRLLDRGIGEILRLMREDLVMDIVLVTVHDGDDVVVRHATSCPGEAGIEGLTHPREESICQRVLQGRLPAIIPDVAALGRTHDVPRTPTVPGAFMAAPVVLKSGRLYGVLCCLNFEAMPDLDERHHQRLRMSAEHIARLVDEAGER